MKRFFSLAMFVTALLGASSNTLADSPQLYIVLDTSGSMKDNMAWIADELMQVQDSLIAMQNLAEELPMTLMGFTEQTKLLAQGNAMDLAAALVEVELMGGTEDGIIPIEKIAQEKPIGRGTHIILITDEDRDVTTHVNIESLKGSLLANGVVVHLIDAVNRTCEKRPSRYRNFPLELYKKDCELKAKLDTENNDYAKLVDATGGKYWWIGDMADRENQFAESLTLDLYENHYVQMDVDVIVSDDKYRGQPIFFDATRHTHKKLSHQISEWTWDFDNDGRADDYGPFTSYVYNQPGEYSVTLTVKDDQQYPTKESKTIQLTIN